MESVSYDVAVWDEFYFPTYQLLQPRVRFRTFNSATGEIPSDTNVISGAEWKSGKQLGYRRIACEASALPCLWLRDSNRNAFCAEGRDIVATEDETVASSGVYWLEHDPQGEFRWTNGEARLTLPLCKTERSKNLAISLLAYRDTTLELFVNDKSVLKRSVPAHQRIDEVLPLHRLPIENELRVRIHSGTFMPTPQGRTLGVQIRKLQIQP